MFVWWYNCQYGVQLFYVDDRVDLVYMGFECFVMGECVEFEVVEIDDWRVRYGYFFFG